MKKVLCFVTVLLFIASSSWAAMKCNSRIVSEGDDRSALISKCGSPDSEDRRAKAVSSNNSTEIIWIDTLVYDCGSSNFMRKVVLENYKIISITTLGKGSGESRCN